MDSTKNTNNYSTSNQLLYGAHFVELAEDVTFEKNVGKFILSYLTPTLSSNSAYDNTTPKNGSNSIVSDTNLGTSRITSSNYKELTIPKHLFSLKEIQTTVTITPNTVHGEEGIISCSPKATKVTHKMIYDDFKKGQKFIVINVGGDVNNPLIIGLG